jgi:uroporphyrinogen-III synthase
VVELAPYRWDRPADPAPILRLLDALDRRAVDALLVTSQAQVDNLFTVANEFGRAVDLSHVAVGAQGPVAEAALERRGIRVEIRPENVHMGPLVLATADYFASPHLEGAPN